MLLRVTSTGAPAARNNEEDGGVVDGRTRSSRALLPPGRSMFVLCLRRILFELCQRGIHVVPRMRVRYPDVHLRSEATRIVQTRGSDRDDLRLRVGLDQNRRTAGWTKPAMGLAACLARPVMKLQRSLQKRESVFRYDYER